MNYEILCLSCVYLILIAEVFIRFLNGSGTVNKTRVQTDADTMRKRESERVRLYLMILGVMKAWWMALVQNPGQSCRVP